MLVTTPTLVLIPRQPKWSCAVHSCFNTTGFSGPDFMSVAHVNNPHQPILSAFLGKIMLSVGIR